MLQEKLYFIAKHYLSLILFIAAFWGIGAALLSRILRVSARDKWLNAALEICVGMGIFIVALQLLGITGLLQRAGVNALMAVGIGLLLLHLFQRKRSETTSKKSISRLEVFGILLIIIYLIPTFIAPLRPPHAWDELMYHLPHAQQWAQSGKIQVNDWLRYPWFPYNIDILYTAGLIIRGDVFTHLLHALSGWLVVLIIYRTGIIYANTLTAFLASTAWIFLTKNEYGSAYIDMGITLLILAACVTFQLSREDEKQRQWIFVTFFLLGLAVGSKYQSLGYMPFFASAFIITERKPKNYLLALIAFLTPCVFWYVRNAVLTGDPLNPIGGKIFGFTDWNIGDYEYQFFDLKNSRGWPQWPVWLAALAPFIPQLRAHIPTRRAMAFSAYAFIVWLVTSRYERYLMPAYPILVLLSAASINAAREEIAGTIASISGASPKRCMGASHCALMIAILMLVVPGSVKITKQYWKNISPTPYSRESYLENNVPGYRLLAYFDNYPAQKIYQWGLEGIIYYAPHPIWGDHFGPWRYRDMVPLAPAELNSKLKNAGFDTLMVHAATVPGLEKQADFFMYFKEAFMADGHKIYKISNPSHIHQ